METPAVRGSGPAAACTPHRGQPATRACALSAWFAGHDQPPSRAPAAGWGFSSLNAAFHAEGRSPRRHTCAFPGAGRRAPQSQGQASRGPRSTVGDALRGRRSTEAQAHPPRDTSRVGGPGPAWPPGPGCSPRARCFLLAGRRGDLCPPRAGLSGWEAEARATHLSGPGQVATVGEASLRGGTPPPGASAAQRGARAAPTCRAASARRAPPPRATGRDLAAFAWDAAKREEGAAGPLLSPSPPPRGQVTSPDATRGSPGFLPSPCPVPPARLSGP